MDPTSATNGQTRKGRGTEVTSLQRGLAVLEMLAQRPNGATLREITDFLSLPGASVLRMARTLVELGYVNREDATKRYFLTHRFFMLGLPRTASRGITECSIGPMRRIREVTRETTQLCCLSDVEMVIIEQLLSFHPFKYSADLGARCPCYSCAPGKAMVAFLSEDEQESILSRITFKRFTATTIASKKAFREEILSIRERGYAVDRAEGMPGIHCVAAPILDRHGSAVAAITIAGPSSRVREDEFEVLGELVREGANAASTEFRQS